MGEQVKIQSGQVSSRAILGSPARYVEVEMVLIRDRGEARVPAARGWLGFVVEPSGEAFAQVIDAHLVEAFRHDLEPAFFEYVQDQVYREAKRLAVSRAMAS